MTEYEYFLYFLRYKIDSGTKQVDIARSTSISTAYLNKLYLRPPNNSCDFSVMTQIAIYFGLTYEEMIAEARQLHIEQAQVEKVLQEIKVEENAGLQETIDHPPEEGRKSRTPASLVNQLSFVSESIQQYETHVKEIEDQRDQLLNILNCVSTGFCIVDDNLKITYQNPTHKRIFGNKEGEHYSCFWDENISTKQFYDNLTTGVYESVERVYNKFHYRVELSATYKGDRIARVMEHVIPLEKQEVENSNTAAVYENLFEEFDEDFGFAFFNLNRELEIVSNNVGNILDNYDYPRDRPTVDQLLLDLNRYKVEDGSEKVHILREIYEDRLETVLTLSIDKKSYRLRTKKIFKKDSFMGMLVVVRKEGGAGEDFV